MSELTQELKERAGLALPTIEIEPSKTIHTDATYFLVINDRYEESIAAEYIKARYPGTKGRLARSLPLLRLTENVIVVPLFRGADRSPAAKTMLDVHGRPFIDHRSPRSLAHEVREGKPVLCARHWHRVNTSTDIFADAFGGTLLTDPFIGALCESCTPCIARPDVGSPNKVLMTFS